MPQSSLTSSSSNSCCFRRWDLAAGLSRILLRLWRNNEFNIRYNLKQIFSYSGIGKQNKCILWICFHTLWRRLRLRRKVRSVGRLSSCWTTAQLPSPNLGRLCCPSPMGQCAVPWGPCRRRVYSRFLAAGPLPFWRVAPSSGVMNSHSQ